MEFKDDTTPVTEKYRSNLNSDDQFDEQEWQDKGEAPGVLQDIGRRLDDSLSSDSQGFKAYLDDLKLTYEMLRSSDFTLKKEIKIVLMIAALYLISPIDLIPDAIPFIGLLDDVLVAGYAMKNISAELRRYRQSKHNLSLKT